MRAATSAVQRTRHDRTIPPSSTPLPARPRPNAVARNNVSISPPSGTIAGPLLNDDVEPVERLADDVLLGAKSIAEHITSLGFPVNETDVYYLHRAKKWPFNKYGVFLIASKRHLTRHAEKLLHGPTAA
jgi:hypothetical protein